MILPALDFRPSRIIYFENNEFCFLSFCFRSTSMTSDVTIFGNEIGRDLTSHIVFGNDERRLTSNRVFSCFFTMPIEKRNNTNGESRRGNLRFTAFTAPVFGSLRIAIIVVFRGRWAFPLSLGIREIQFVIEAIGFQCVQLLYPEIFTF